MSGPDPIGPKPPVIFDGGIAELDEAKPGELAEVAGPTPGAQEITGIAASDEIAATTAATRAEFQQIEAAYAAGELSPQAALDALLDAVMPQGVPAETAVLTRELLGELAEHDPFLQSLLRRL